MKPVRFVDHGFDDGIHDLAAVHADADVVADFVGFGRHETSLAKWEEGSELFDLPELV
jgi:hypothetical protein